MTRSKAYDAGGGAKVHKRDILNSITMETSPGDDEDTAKNSKERPQNGSHLWKGLEVFHSGWNFIHRRVYRMEKPQHVHDRLVQNKMHDGKVQQRPSDCHQKFERVKEEDSKRTNWTKGNGWGAGLRKAQLKAADGARGGNPSIP